MLTFGLIKLTVALIVMIGAGFGGFKEVSRRAAAHKRLRSAPSVVSEHEYVTVTGTVRALGEVLTAPLAGTPCVLHSSTVRSFLNGDRSTQLGERTVFAMTAFVVETANGDIYIAGDAAELTTPGKPVAQLRVDRAAAFLVACGWPNANLRNIDCEELVIVAGDHIAVHGVANVDVVAGAGLETGYRDAGQRTTLVGTAQRPLTIELR